MLCGPDKVPDLLASPVLWGSQPSQPEPTPHNSLVDIIRENAAGPAEAHGDSGGVKQQPLPDMVIADKHLGAKNAMTRKNFGLTRVQIIPPGTV